MSISLWSHGLQHAKLPSPSPTFRARSNFCPSRRWCHPTISSSVVPFSSCLQPFPASGSFPISQFFPSSGESTGTLASVNPSNEYSGLISFRIDLFDLLAVQGALKSLLLREHHSWKASILWCSAFFMFQLSHPHMTTGKTVVLARQTFVGQVMSLLFNLPPTGQGNLKELPWAWLNFSQVSFWPPFLFVRKLEFLNTFSASLRCNLLQPRNAFLKDLGPNLWKYNHQN